VDLAVFALDALDPATDASVDDLPRGGSRLRRPGGNYRATIVAGVPVQLGGEPTGARPGRVLQAR
jgi:N-acyl-D-aspartate/D-glutamate deacylase